MSAVTLPPSVFGVPQLRSEDPRFLRGRGRYLENVPIPGVLTATFVRSIMAHARVLTVDVEAARSMPGVVAVYTADDLEIPPMPPSGNVEGASGEELAALFGRHVLARDRVRFVGEPVAVVIAGSLAQGQDAAESVLVEYDALAVVVDPEAAAEDGSPLLFEGQGSNVVHTLLARWDQDVLAGADVVARGRFVNQRLAPCPMEPDAIAVIPQDDGAFTVWVSTQVPFDVRNDLAEVLGVDKRAVRTIAPDVGGGFGAKLQLYPEYAVVAVAAQRLGRPIRWVETRTESMLGLTHGRAQVQTVEIGATRDGTLVGLRADLLADLGAYPIAAFLPDTTQEMLSGVYAFPAIACRVRAVVTNTTPVGAYRGAGRPEAAALVERAIDRLAAELGMDPIALRRKNFIPPAAFPFTTAAQTRYDTGDYAAALDAALELAGYDGLRQEQRRRRERGDPVCLGIGVATYVEITSFASKEFGSVEVGPDGAVTLMTGASPHGQGHETAFAQLASGVLGIPFERIRVIHSDTGVVPRGAGTWGSRSLQAAGSAIAEQSQAVVAKARRIASHALEVDEDDLELREGAFRVTGAPERAIGWSDLAGLAADPSRMPEGIEPGLASSGVFRELDSTFPFGAHVAVVEVDTRTGDVRLVRHVAVDDCGRILNPVLVDGQVHGGLGQGIAQALYEEVLYDELGNPLTATFTGYAFPSAADLPAYEVAHTETPTPHNPLGAKGIGESATIGSTPAVQNAAVDALAHLGIGHLDLPLAPERVWRAIHEASG
jgi:aerobic carbon-monoxide dehydrogenase large subunit